MKQTTNTAATTLEQVNAMPAATWGWLKMNQTKLELSDELAAAPAEAVEAEGSKATVSCQSLMLDDQSRSDTIPAMDIRAKNVDIGHEATIGRIGDDKVFYLMSRGISEEEARTMIVNGFANPVSKELPLEYAVEMNNLIKLEMEGAIG